MTTRAPAVLTNKLLKINFNKECNFELFVDGIYSLGWARKQSGHHWNIYFSTLRTVLTILTLGKCFVFNVDIDGVAFYWFEIVKIYSHPFGICLLLFAASNVNNDKHSDRLISPARKLWLIHTTKGHIKVRSMHCFVCVASYVIFFFGLFYS